MSKNRKKIEYLFMLACVVVLSVFAPVSVSAANFSDLTEEELFRLLVAGPEALRVEDPVSEEENTVESYIRKVQKDAAYLRQDFVFGTDATVLPAYAENPDTAAEVTVYGESVNLKETQAVIEAIPFNSSAISLTFRYISAEGVVPCFITRDGTRIPADDASSEVSVTTEDDYSVLNLVISKSDFERLCTYNEGGENILAFLLDSNGEDLVLKSTSVSFPEGGYGLIGPEQEGNCLTEPALYARFETSTVETSYIVFEMEENEIVADIIGADDIELQKLDEGGCPLRTEYLNDITGFDSYFIEEQDSAGADIAESESLSIEEGASGVYRDTYLFTENKTETIVKYFGRSLGTDILLNAFAEEGKLNGACVSDSDPVDYLGDIYDPLLLPAGVVTIDVAAEAENSYAGELTVYFEGEENSSIHVNVASPSDALKKTDVEAETAGNAENADAAYRFMNFLKTDGECYQAATGDVLLSEAFLKKASYYATDELGSVIAVYNTHGQLVSLAEGYTENDVYSYTLVLSGEAMDGEVLEVSLSEISVSYNDVMIADKDYAKVSYYGDNFTPAESFMQISAYAGSDSSAYIALKADCKEQRVCVMAAFEDGSFEVIAGENWELIDESEWNDFEVEACDEVTETEEDHEVSEAVNNDTQEDKEDPAGTEEQENADPTAEESCVQDSDTVEQREQKTDNYPENGEGTDESSDEANEAIDIADSGVASGESVDIRKDIGTTEDSDKDTLIDDTSVCEDTGNAITVEQESAIDAGEEDTSVSSENTESTSRDEAGTDEDESTDDDGSPSEDFEPDLETDSSDKFIERSVKSGEIAVESADGGQSEIIDNYTELENSERQDTGRINGETKTSSVNETENSGKSDNLSLDAEGSLPADSDELSEVAAAEGIDSSENYGVEI